MKTKSISYGDRAYEFPVTADGITIPADELHELPKGLLVIVYFMATTKAWWLASATFKGVWDATKNWVAPRRGGLTAAGTKDWGNDPEVVAMAHKHREHLSKKTPTKTEHDPDVGKHVESDREVDSAAGAVSEGAFPHADPVTPESVSVASSPPHDLCALLDLIHEFLLRFVVFVQPEQAVAVTVWIAHTWVFELFPFTPYLHIYSPTRRCGKSRLLECLHALVSRPWSVVSATEATIMRKIDLESPTLLYDEVDTIFRSSRDKSKEGQRAVINAGFARGAKVPRCVGREVVELDVFCPKAFAGIGDCLPDTVKDRSIRIQLTRRAKNQIVEKFRFRDFEDSIRGIVEKLTSWAGDEEVMEKLQLSRPATPEEIGDRAADISEPLLAISDMAGGEWPQAVRAALVELLRANDEEETEEPGVKLLAAIRSVFSAAGKRQLPTVEILKKLAGREEEEVWTTQWPRDVAAGNIRGPAARMAGLLRPFRIFAGTIRLPDGSTPKGYRLEAFLDAFSRYLPDLLQKKDATTPHESPDTDTPASRLPSEKREETPPE